MPPQYCSAGEAERPRKKISRLSKERLTLDMLLKHVGRNRGSLGTRSETGGPSRAKRDSDDERNEGPGDHLTLDTSRSRRRCIGWTVDSNRILVRCPELFTPTTAADGRPKKYHSTKCLMWTYARSALGYVPGDVYIKGQFRGTKQILQCDFRGGIGLPEKWREVELPEGWGGELPEQYRPPKPCLGQFEKRPNCRPAKSCEVCSPFAKALLSALKANANYKADPVKGAKIALKNRHKRRKAAGRPIRPIGSMQPCQYPDKHGGKRAEGCEITFKVGSSAQKFCDPCQLRADADRAQAYRDAHPEEVKATNVLRWKSQRERLNGAKRLENIEGLDLKTGLRVSLLAHRFVEGAKLYDMREGDIVYPNSQDPFAALRQLKQRFSPTIEAEQTRIAALTGEQRRIEKAQLSARLSTEEAKPKKTTR